tara:strand:- start:2891 stop:4150 length:1260 start_codon:yes stop_codon:yes gene_type:complete
MGDLWNLNIDDYDLNELQNLFKLKDPFTLEDVINADTKFREHIYNDNNVDVEKKTEINHFLEKAKNALVKNIKKEMKVLTNDIYNNSYPTIKNNFQKPISSQLVSSSISTNDGKNHSVYNKTVTINSIFRKNYNKTLSTNFDIELQSKITNAASMELAYLQMPETYYHFSKEKGNNYFWFGWDKGGVGLKWYYVNIPDGTYIRTELEEIINNNMEMATGLDPLTPLCKIDITSQKTVFSVADPNDTLQLKFNQTRHGNNVTTATSISEANWKDKLTSNHLAENFGWIMGFRAAEYINSDSYVSEGLFDWWGPKIAFVIVEDYQKNYANIMEPTYPFSLGHDNILAKLSLPPITSNEQTGISYGDDATTYTDSETGIKRLYQGPVNIDKLHISIVDEYGKIINLNNMDISLGINFKCLVN